MVGALILRTSLRHAVKAECGAGASIALQHVDDTSGTSRDPRGDYHLVGLQFWKPCLHLIDFDTASEVIP